MGRWGGPPSSNPVRLLLWHRFGAHLATAKHCCGAGQSTAPGALPAGVSAGWVPAGGRCWGPRCAPPATPMPLSRFAPAHPTSQPGDIKSPVASKSPVTSEPGDMRSPVLCARSAARAAVPAALCSRGAAVSDGARGGGPDLWGWGSRSSSPARRR